MLKARIATALVLALMLISVLFWMPFQWAIAAFGFATALGGWEWAGLGGVSGIWGRIGFTALITVFSMLVWLWCREPRHALFVYGLACAWWCAAFVWLSLAPDFRPRTLVLACGLLVLIPSFVAVCGIYASATGPVRGPQAVLWLLGWIFSADIGAYFAGRTFGRIQLAPRVSPGKTWEGVLGGVAFSTGVAALGAWWFQLRLSPTLAFGAALVTLSVVGDLTESMFKRGAGLKDSGHLLPGHGGVLDRIDSITAAAPLYALGIYSYGAIH